MRAVIYLVSGVLCSVLLYPPQLYSALLALRSAPSTIPGPGQTNAPFVAGEYSHAMTAFLRGTNRVPTDTLLRSGLAPDTLEKGADLDGDGDADEIHLRLEVAELADAASGQWAFVPKAFGRIQWQRGQEAGAAQPPSSPDLHVEQGDRLLITLENTHHLPHGLLFEGLDAQPVTAQGMPVNSATAAQPGEARTYLLMPLSVGTASYKADAASAVAMGLQGRLIVAENLPDNPLQTVGDDWQLRPAPAVQSLALTPQPPAMDTAQLLQFSGFGLALGLALAGLLGVLLPLRRKQTAKEKVS